MGRISALINSLSMGGKITVISLFCAAVFYISYLITNLQITSITNGYSLALMKGDSVRKGNVDSLTTYLKLVDSSAQFAQKMKTIKTQYYIVSNIRNATFALAKRYFGLYYTFTTLFIITTIFTVIIVFLIANTGWSNTTPIIKTVFFNLFFISSFQGLMISTLDLKDNYEQNLAQEISYLKLEDKIYTFVNSCDTLSPMVRLSTSIAFIQNVNTEFENNYKFSIDIKSQDYYNELFKDISSKTSAKP